MLVDGDALLLIGDIAAYENVLAFRDIFSVKLPLMSEAVAIAVFSIARVAPMMVSPVRESITLPLIVYCAWAVKSRREKNNEVNKSLFKNVVCINFSCFVYAAKVGVV